MSLTVAILAGGLATRLRPVTEAMPKSLVDVGGRPFVAHQLDLLARHGFTDIVLLAGHLGELLRDALGSGTDFGVRLRYAFDGPEPMGTGGAVRGALAELGDAFFVMYGDSYLECDYGDIERAFRACGKSGLMTVCRNEDRWDRSNVLFEGGRIVAYDKVRRIPEMRHIDYGLGAFMRAAFTRRPPGRAFDLADVYRELLSCGDLAGYEVASRFYEIGSPAGLEETRAHVEARGRTLR